ncbi:MAG: hypothetical protein KF817_07970 [Phycisphaeraceae bacterium]|nr:hypothetical protein [Phycisphaeraceae bacterium]
MSEQGPRAEDGAEPGRITRDAYDLESAPERVEGAGALPLDEPLIDGRCAACGADRLMADGACVRCGTTAPDSHVAAIADPSAPGRDGADEGRSDAEGAASGDAGLADADRPIAVPRPSDRWLPGTIGGLAVLLMLVGLIAGMASLFPGVDIAAAAPVPWSTRLSGVVRLPLFIATWSGCALGALATVAWLRDRPLGHLPAALLRLAAIITVARLGAFLDVPVAVLRFPAELVAHAAIFWVLAIAMFRLRPRDAGILLGLTLLYGIVLLFATALIEWSMSGW